MLSSSTLDVVSLALEHVPTLPSISTAPSLACVDRFHHSDNLVVKIDHVEWGRWAVQTMRSVIRVGTQWVVFTQETPVPAIGDLVTTGDIHSHHHTLEAGPRSAGLYSVHELAVSLEIQGILSKQNPGRITSLGIMSPMPKLQ
jgi:hypothetical protein